MMFECPLCHGKKHKPIVYPDGRMGCFMICPKCNDKGKVNDNIGQDSALQLALDESETTE